MKEGREKKEINKNKVRCPGEKKGREERKGEGQKENMKGKRRKGGRKRRKKRRRMRVRMEETTTTSSILIIEITMSTC